MAANEDDTWKSLVAQIAKETEAEKLRRIAATFNRILDDESKKSTSH
jgi:hypothetical protein